jgi:hypothetical protein
MNSGDHVYCKLGFIKFSTGDESLVARVAEERAAVEIVSNYAALAAALDCAKDSFGPGKMLFASVMPFGASDGWEQVPITLQIVRDTFAGDADAARAVLVGNAQSWLLRGMVEARTALRRPVALPTAAPMPSLSS